jgi:hypothetical protein
MAESSARSGRSHPWRAGLSALLRMGPLTPEERPAGQRENGTQAREGLVSRVHEENGLQSSMKDRSVSAHEEHGPQSPVTGRMVARMKHGPQPPMESRSVSAFEDGTVDTRRRAGRSAREWDSGS